jgi:hypothetical protein
MSSTPRAHCLRTGRYSEPGRIYLLTGLPIDDNQTSRIGVLDGCRSMNSDEPRKTVMPLHWPGLSCLITSTGWLNCTMVICRS